MNGSNSLLMTNSVPSAAGENTGFRAGNLALPLLLLGISVLLLFLSVPYEADLWWSDATRHTMDGVFFHDLIRDLPVGHLKQYAMDYYIQYPALATLFYPPLFSLAEAVSFAIFGVSKGAALLTVAVFYLAAAWGIFVLSRRWLDGMAAFAVSLLFVGAPEVTLWGRQIMLEIPACAFLIWSGVVFFRYLDQNRPGLFYLLVILLSAGAYTKQTVLFIVPVFAWILYSRKGRAIFRDRHIWGGVALLGLSLLPLVWVTLTLARFNVELAVHEGATQDPVFSLAGLSYYLRQFPQQTNWILCVLAATTLIATAVRKSWRGEAEKFFAGWLVLGYIFFSLIALKDSRYTVLILLPLAFFAVRGVVGFAPRIGPYLVLVFSLACYGYTLLERPVPYVLGYAEAVDYVATHAPHGGVVMFSGYRDGAFVVDMRLREDRRDLSVLRADKLLLKVKQRRDLGVSERNITEAETAEMLNLYGVSYVVDQPNFWDDLKNMQQLQRVLHTKQFRLVDTIAIVSNVGHLDRKLEIYQNLGPLNAHRERIRMELPMAGLVMEGKLGE